MGSKSSSSKIHWHYFELIDEESSKFWQVAVDGSSLTTCYGNIGTAGRKTTKDFSSEDEANSEARWLMVQKMKKGYIKSEYEEKAAKSKSQNVLKSQDGGVKSATQKKTSDSGLTEKIDPKKKVPNISKALWTAMGSGKIEAFEKVVKDKEKVALSQKDGTTVLMLASLHGYLDIVRQLIQLGVNVNARRDDTLTALALACWNNHAEVVLELIQNDADISFEYAVQMGQGRVGKQTALILAAHRGNLEVSKILVDAGSDLNAESEVGYTPLMASMVNGASKTLAEFLLSCGADPDPKIANFSLMTRAATPLILATINGWADIVSQLISLGVDVNKPDGVHILAQEGECTPLKHAIQNDRLDIAEALIAAGAKVNTADYSGWTPLMNAAVEGQAELVSLLLNHGADPNIRIMSKGLSKEDKGETALILAARNGQAEVASLLIAAGADVDMDSALGASPLSSSIEAYRRSEELTSLMHLIGDVESLNEIQGSVAELDLKGRSIKVAQLLLDNGASCDVMLKGTPLLEIIQSIEDDQLKSVFDEPLKDFSMNFNQAKRLEADTQLSSKLELIRPAWAKKQVTEAKELKLDLLKDLQQVAQELSLDARAKAMRLFKLIERSDESFDFIVNQQKNSKTFEDKELRLGSMIGGPFFISENFPQNLGWMPVIQLDLQALSAVLSENLGDELIQLWYVQGRGADDVDNARIILIPRSEVDVNRILPWRRHDYDSAEFTPIDPLPVDPFIGFYWYGRFLLIDGIVSKGVQCQDDLTMKLMNELQNELGPELRTKISKFIELCPFSYSDDHLNQISLFGTFCPSDVSHDEVGTRCLVVLHQLGDGDGSCQLFMDTQDNERGQFYFHENWDCHFEALSKEERDDFIRHAR